MVNPEYRNIGTPAMRVVEECGEVIKAVMKGERFGYRSCNYLTWETNLDCLKRELNDVIEAVRDLENGVIDAI